MLQIYNNLMLYAYSFKALSEGCEMKVNKGTF